MIVLVLGVLLFAGLHLIAAVPPLKAALKAKTGEAAYGAVFGAVSLVAILLIVLGWRSAGIVAAYDPPAWGWHANLGLTFLAFLFLGIFLFRGRLRQIVRFPMGIAVVLWAIGHLMANGDVASLILFGGLLGYSLVHMVLGLANGVRPTTEIRAGHDMLSMMAGLTLYVAMTQLHPVLIGVPVLTLAR